MNSSINPARLADMHAVVYKKPLPFPTPEAKLEVRVAGVQQMWYHMGDFSYSPHAWSYCPAGGRLGISSGAF
jgi:hypothetical protein